MAGDDRVETGHAFVSLALECGLSHEDVAVSIAACLATLNLHPAQIPEFKNPKMKNKKENPCSHKLPPPSCVEAKRVNYLKCVYTGPGRLPRAGAGGALGVRGQPTGSSRGR